MSSAYSFESLLVYHRDAFNSWCLQARNLQSEHICVEFHAQKRLPSDLKYHVMENKSYCNVHFEWFELTLYQIQASVGEMFSILFLLSNANYLSDKTN